MKKDELTETVSDLGLSRNESLIYISALNHGPTTALALSRDTGIKRSTIYGLVESLKAKGLMRTEFSGSKKRLVVESPQHLASLLEYRKEKLDRVMPKLTSLYNLGGKESFIRYHEGLAGLKAVYEEILREARLDDTLCVIAHQHEWLERDPAYFTQFLSRRARAIRHTRILFQDSEMARHYQLQGVQLRQTVKLFPRNFSFPADILITSKSVIIHQWKNPIMVLVIENKDVVQTQQALFDYIWDTMPSDATP